MTADTPELERGKPWICPKCDRVWGPTVTACAPCNSRGPFGSKRKIVRIAR